MIIELDNVELSFDKKRILSGVYLKAETGKVTGLLGRNGSGKSCLLQLLFGSLQPKYKLIRIDGKPILKPLYSLNIAAFLTQQHFTPNHLKIKTLFHLMQLDWTDFISHFEDFAPYYDENITVNKLSGGERRLIETYAVLKQKRKIILLDEPFSNIAPLYIEKIKTLITSEKSQKAILITDHYYRDVIEISDTLYLLNNGCTKQIEQLRELESYNYLNFDTL